MHNLQIIAIAYSGIHSHSIHGAPASCRPGLWPARRRRSQVVLSANRRRYSGRFIARPNRAVILEAFRQLHQAGPEELACFHFLSDGVPNSYHGKLFFAIRGKAKPSLDETRADIGKLAGGKVCSARLRKLLDGDVREPGSHLPLASVLAWLRVSGGNSALPPWVLRQMPAPRRFIRELRDTACGSRECLYCSQHHDPLAEMKRYFNHEAFRPEPQNGEAGQSRYEFVGANSASPGSPRRPPECASNWRATRAAWCRNTGR